MIRPKSYERSTFSLWVLIMVLACLPESLQGQRPLEDLKNYVAFSEQLHSCGTINTRDLQTLKTKGIESIISLIDENPSQTILLKRKAEEMGLNFIHVPVSWKKPNLSSLARFFSAMESAAQTKLLVHCRVNWRASAFVYLYQVYVQKVNEAEARAVLLSVWNPWKNKTWTQFFALAKEKFQ